MNAPRLTHSQIAEVRNAQIAAQGGKCALCQLPGVAKDPVLDHHHGTGAVRGTLHRSCNALLGKVENNAPRFGVTNLQAFGHGLAQYLAKHSTNITGLTHPTYKTEDEKRIARNTKARKVRAEKKKG
ncbi:MAG: exonuclease VII [Burkholderiales bacterium]|jgi:hypothetical protein|nr:exonuclease VII [Burkholderiales bacterium]